MTRILGIDPGTVRTGYGVVETSNGRSVYVSCGCIRTSKAPMPERLAEIYRGITELIAEHKPAEMAIEAVFLARNPGSALKLGQARGVAIAAGVAGGLSVHEYAPRLVKKTVVGNGAAAKSQVAHMVRILLNLPGEPGEDAADALAIAICHVHSSLRR